MSGTLKEIYESMKSKKLELLLFVTMGPLYFFSYFQRVAVPGTIFNQLQGDFGISAAAVTGIGATFLYIYAFSQLFVGMLTDKYGGRRLLLAGGTMLVTGSILFPLSQNLPMLYASRALTGLGASTMYLSIVKESDIMFGRKNFSMMLGIIFFTGYSGGLAGTLPFERLVHYTSWRSSLIGIGIVTGIMLVGFYFMSRKLKREALTQKQLTLKPLIDIAKNRLNWPLLFSCPVNFSIYFTLQSVLGKKFLEDYGQLDSSKAAFFTFIMMLFAMTTLFSSGLASRMLGNRRKIFIMTATSLCMINSIMMMSALILNIKGDFILIFFILFAVTSGFLTIFVSTIQELNPKECTALSAGTLNFMCYFSVAVIAHLAGFVMDLFKPEAAQGQITVYPPQAYICVFGILSALSIASFFVSFRIRETHGKHI